MRLYVGQLDPDTDALIEDCRRAVEEEVNLAYRQFQQRGEVADLSRAVVRTRTLDRYGEQLRRQVERELVHIGQGDGRPVVLRLHEQPENAVYQAALEALRRQAEIELDLLRRQIDAARAQT